MEQHQRVVVGTDEDIQNMSWGWVHHVHPTGLGAGVPGFGWPSYKPSNLPAIVGKKGGGLWEGDAGWGCFADCYSNTAAGSLHADCCNILGEVQCFVCFPSDPRPCPVELNNAALLPLSPPEHRHCIRVRTAISRKNMKAPCQRTPRLLSLQGRLTQQNVCGRAGAVLLVCVITD